MATGTPKPDRAMRLFRTFAYAVQFFFGGWFFYNGLNYFVGFTPPPPGSSPATRELMAGLEQTGLFAVVKGVELVAGAALLANRFVPLAALVAFPITFSIAWVMIVINGGIVGYVVGTLALAFNGVIALSRLEHFRPVLAYSDCGPRLPQAVWKRSGATSSEPPRPTALKPATHAICIFLGVSLSVGIELGTMAYFQSVARSLMPVSQADGGRHQPDKGG